MALFRLSTVRLECRSDEVKGTMVLLVLDAKTRLLNDIAVYGDEIARNLRLLRLLWTGFDEQRSFRGAFPRLTVLGRHP